MSESQLKASYEVQTYTLFGWTNTWSEDEEPQLFETRQEADDAILEFFADLGAAGMAQNYDLEDYRVWRVT